MAEAAARQKSRFSGKLRAQALDASRVELFFRNGGGAGGQRRGGQQGGENALHGDLP